MYHALLLHRIPKPKNWSRLHYVGTMKDLSMYHGLLLRHIPKPWNWSGLHYVGTIKALTKFSLDSHKLIRRRICIPGKSP